MTGNEPPEDDPSEAPTGYYDYNGDGQGDPRRGTPWYRRPIITVAIGLFAAILLGLAIYYLADQTHGTGGTTQTPTSPTTSTTAPTSVTTTSTEPVAPSATTTPTEPPTTTEPTTTTPTTTVDEGHHHHHHHDGGTP